MTRKQISELVERAFKQGAGYAMVVDLRQEGGVDQAWDWSQAKADLEDLLGETKKSDPTPFERAA